MSLRTEMVNALRLIVIPKLREQGFTGTYPHFRRFGAEKIDLLTFQFNKWGGSFLVEISVAYPKRTEYRNFYLVGNQDYKTIDTSNTYARYRLAGQKNDDWFIFGEDDLNEVAEHVVNKLPSAYEWWANPPILEELEQRKRTGLKY